MERIKAIFRTNIRAIVFFGIILFGVLSFISSRNQEIEKIKTLQTFADGSFGLIENEYGIITNKTLIADDTAESYDKIIQDLKNLQLQVDEIIQSVPKQNNSSSTYDETVNNLEYFLGDIFVTLTIEMDRYEQEKDLLNDKKDYFDFKENGLDFNKSERALEVLLGVAKLEQWYFDTSEKNDGNYNQRSDELVKKIEEMNNSSNLDPKKIEELYNQTGYFSYTKLFRITQKSNLQTDEYFENLDSLYENLNLLKSQYNLD